MHEAWLERQYWADVVARRPDDLIARRGEESRLTRELHSTTLDLSYGEHARQKVDVFLPSGGSARALVVYVHGGYWQSNHKDDYAFLAPGWVEQGVAFATVGYRLLPEATLTEIVTDAEAAIRLLREREDEFAIDWRRTVAVGHSAGAHLVAMAATQSQVHAPAAAVLLSGVYDLRPLVTTTPGPALAGSLDAELRAITPLARDAPGVGDCLIAWGSAETDVFVSQSQTLANYWCNRGLRPRVLEVPDVDHFTIVEGLRADASGELIEFVRAATKAT